MGGISFPDPSGKSQLWPLQWIVVKLQKYWFKVFHKHKATTEGFQQLFLLPTRVSYDLDVSSGSVVHFEGQVVHLSLNFSFLWNGTSRFFFFSASFEKWKAFLLLISYPLPSFLLPLPPPPYYHLHKHLLCFRHSVSYGRHMSKALGPCRAFEEY